MARKRVIDLTSDSTLSKNHSGSLITLSKAAGLTVTLPSPGRGLEYDFVIKTAITHSTGGYVITVPDTADASVKGAVAVGSADGTVKTQVSSGSEKISTTSAAGGLIGSYYKVVCNNDGKWEVTGIGIGTGTTTVFA